MNIVIIKVKYIIFNLFIGSTLVIMKSKDEPNSLFGGMAIPPWHSNKILLAIQIMNVVGFSSSINRAISLIIKLFIIKRITLH